MEPSQIVPVSREVEAGVTQAVREMQTWIASLSLSPAPLTTAPATTAPPTLPRPSLSLSPPAAAAAVGGAAVSPLSPVRKEREMAGEREKGAKPVLRKGEEPLSPLSPSLSQEDVDLDSFLNEFSFSSLSQSSKQAQERETQKKGQVSRSLLSLSFASLYLSVMQEKELQEKDQLSVMLFSLALSPPSLSPRNRLRREIHR